MHPRSKQNNSKKVFNQLLSGLSEGHKKMFELLSIFPCSAKEASERFPELNMNPIFDVTLKVARLEVAAQEALGVHLPSSCSAEHLLRIGLKTGIHPVSGVALH